MEGEKYQVKSMWFKDEDRQKILDIQGERFVVKAIFPKDRMEIARMVAIRQTGLPKNSFSPDEQYIFERSALIDVAIVESPEWWKGADSCPDEALLDEINGEIVKFSNEFQERLKKNKLPKRSAEKSISD